jgi:glycosyltransferase involved in cell wall biosynthesis
MKEIRTVQAARNTGIRNSCGYYILFFSDDDYFFPREH